MPITQPIPSVDKADDLTECAQMLDQSIEEVRSCKDLAEKRLTALEKQTVKTAQAEGEIAYLKGLVKKLEDRVTFLESIKCTKIKFLVFVITVRYCR